MSRIWANRYLVLALGLLLVLPQCLMKDPVTGKSTFSLLSESQEVELGRASHQSVIEGYGLYNDNDWQAFVTRVGQSLAKVSHRPQLEYHFYVVDSPVVNAFALPGGWVYFTRGILAHFNSEDELAGVMGHEIGHVTARHGAEQYSRAQVAGLGLELATAFSPKLGQYRGFLEMGAGLLFLKFSRNQESESDKLGVSYASTVGYDTHDMAGFFNTIARISGGSGQSLPTFLSTHPNPLNREKRVHELTDEFRAQNAYNPKKTDRQAYLRRLEGLVFGDDPRQGFFDEQKGMFFHPAWNIQFPVPNGWQLQRNSLRFQLAEPNQKAVILLQKTTESMSSQDAAGKFLEQSQAREINREDVRLNGFQAVRLNSEIVSGNDKLNVLSYFIGGGKGDLYIGHGVSESGDFGGMQAAFLKTLGGFSTLTDREAKNKKPDRVRIKPAPRNGSLGENLSSLGFKDDGERNRLALLNGMALDDQVKRGDLLKTVSQ